MDNTFVVGDVHGCFYTLQKLLKKLPQDARVIFVGDLIDRGNYSKEVVEFVKLNNYESIMGNHEALMLEHIEDALLYEKKSQWSNQSNFGGHKTVHSYKNDIETLQKHLEWMRRLPRYIEIGYYFITHAFGLPYYRRRDVTSSYRALMSNRPSNKKIWGFDWEEGYEYYDIINIYGHAVVEQIQTNKNHIGIDTGAVYGNRLSAIELHSRETISVSTDKRDII